MKTIGKLSLFFLALVFLFSACQKDEELTQILEDESGLYTPDLKNGEVIEGQYIVVFKKEALSSLKSATTYKAKKDLMKNEIESCLKTKNLDFIQNIYVESLYGFSGKLDDNQLSQLKNDDRVDYIEEDKLIMLGKPPWAGGGDDEDPTQETPWGITRVNGGTATSDATAWIIDSGIDLDHPDLNVDVSRSVTYVPRSKNANDENGHGSHVAGTIAAIDNNIGVIGVAPGATVVAVRVLDRRGSGTYSAVIAGVDYVAANGSNGDVANMSLGGPVSNALDQAVINAASNGIIFCLAAGNESDDANNHSPARVNHNNVYTISAMDINDNWAYFSNYGNPPVDYCAPGVSIKSCWKNGGYSTIDGTSMASPHAAGVLLLGAAHNGGTVNGDPDNNSDIIITH
ncbi:MAG: S8 family peptidase [Bacteroidales bacterium]|nr:S8 family peptidase [Bacteroidales bacterium]